MDLPRLEKRLPNSAFTNPPFCGAKVLRPLTVVRLPHITFARGG